MITCGDWYYQGNDEKGSWSNDRTDLYFCCSGDEAFAISIAHKIRKYPPGYITEDEIAQEVIW
jgi:hypothetical protein